jgi:hypothetical protein
MKLTSIVTVAIAGAFAAISVLAQEEGQEKTGGMMGEPGHPKMAEMHRKMMADMKAKDAELDKLVGEMNTATGEKKLAAVAAVVNELVQEREAVQERMAAMHESMEGGKDWDRACMEHHKEWCEKHHCYWREEDREEHPMKKDAPQGAESPSHDDSSTAQP